MRRNEGIPCADGSYDGFAVVPTPESSNADDVGPYLKKCVGKLDALKRLAPDNRSQGKYLATTKWLTSLRDDWSRISKAVGLPREVSYCLPEP